MGNTFELVYETLESKADAFPGKEFSIAYFIPAKLYSVVNRMDFYFLSPENKLLAKTECLDRFDRRAYIFPAPEKDDIVHVPYRSDFEGMLQVLVEIIQVEIREELRKDTAYRDSLAGLENIERARMKKFVVTAARRVAVDNAVESAQENGTSDVLSDFRF